MTADAAAEEPCRPKRRKTKKAKTKKDKWGQPVLAPAEDAEEELEEAPPPEEEEEEEEAVPVNGRDGESYEPKKVVVSGLPYTTSEQQIRDLFKDVGPVVQLQLSRFPDSGNFSGLAFVTLETQEMAINSLAFDGTKMGNRYIQIELCRLDARRKRKSVFLDEAKKVDGCLSAYIGNLSWKVTEDDIRERFKDSKISSVRFALDKRTGGSRGFCHVDFEDDESLEKAMKKNQYEIHGRPMKIAYAVSNRN